MFRSRAKEVGTDREGDAGSPPLASKWWETIENCGSRQCPAPRDKLPRDAPRNPPPHPGSRAPAEPPGLARAGSPWATSERSTRGPPRAPRRASHLSSPEHPPRLPKPPLHALRAAALRRALQPGEARVSAELSPSSPGSHGSASEQGEETGPRAVRRPASSRGPRPAPARPLTCQLPASRAFLAPRR